MKTPDERILIDRIARQREEHAQDEPTDWEAEREADYDQAEQAWELKTGR